MKETHLQNIFNQILIIKIKIMKKCYFLLALIAAVWSVKAQNNVIFLNNFSQVVEIPITLGGQVDISVSNSIVSPDVAGESSEDPQLLAIFGVSNGQDGSEFVGKVFQGTNYFNSTAETWSFTANSGTDKIWAVGIGISNSSNLERKFEIQVNGATHEILPENMIFLNDITEVKQLSYSMGADVQCSISNSIVSPDIAGESSEDPQLLMMYGVANGQDGSEFIGGIFEGTNYFNSTSQNWNYTSNSGSEKIWAVAVGTSTNNNLERKFEVNVNGTDYLILPSSTSSISDISSKNIKIFPSLTVDELNISVKDHNLSGLDVEVFNLSGKMVFMKKYSTNEIKINTSYFSSGTYLIKLKDSDGHLIKSEKFIKQ